MHTERTSVPNITEPFRLSLQANCPQPGTTMDFRTVGRRALIAFRKSGVIADDVLNLHDNEDDLSSPAIHI